MGRRRVAAGGPRRRPRAAGAGRRGGGDPGGYADGPGLTAALAGADTVHLVSAAEAPDRLQQHRTAVAAAAGVRRIVHTSFLGAAPAAVFTLARRHAAIEEAIRATGLRHTVLRHAVYADFVPFFAVWEVEGWVSSYRAIAAGEPARVTDVVPRLTGHPARTVAEHPRAHPEDWAHLRPV